MSRPRPVDEAALRRVRADERYLTALGHRFPPAGWRSRGLCLQHHPEMFFPATAEDPSPAQAVCAACPVRGECLASALEIGDCDGVWGGTVTAERRAMREAWMQDVVRVPVG